MKIQSKASKLKSGDKIKVGGIKYKITCLTRTFGSDREDTVRLNLRQPDASATWTSFSLPHDAVVKVNRKK